METTTEQKFRGIFISPAAFAPPVFGPGFHRINSGRVDARMSKDVRQADNILLQSIVHPRKQVPQIDSIQAAISEKAEEFGIPVAFYPDDVGKDSFLNFNIADEPCLVMYHPDHKDDYFKFCIRISRSGAYTFVSVNDFGQQFF